MRILGKAFEATISHIYETLFRVDVSETSNIGNILKKIEIETKTIVNPKSDEKQFTKVSKQIFDLCQELREHNGLSSCEVLNKFQKLGETIKLQEKQPNKANSESILFPKNIQRHLDIVKEYRNTIADHTQEVLVYNDVIKMLFSYIQICLWWKNSYEKIKNWDSDRKSILEEFVNMKNS